MVQDRAILTMGQTNSNVSNSAIFNDLGRPLTKYSSPIYYICPNPDFMSHHYLTLNVSNDTNRWL